MTSSKPEVNSYPRMHEENQILILREDRSLNKLIKVSLVQNFTVATNNLQHVRTSIVEEVGRF